MREPMHELIRSEKDYIEDLRKCIEVYISEFDEAGTAHTLPNVLRGRRKEIFGNYEKIYAFHAEKFLHELSKYEDDPEEVGCSFTVWVDYLNELYTDYCVNMEQNHDIITLPEAIQFFSAIREKHKLENNNDLNSMLIKPVQRCTRYQLMMDQLLKNCTGNLDEIRLGVLADVSVVEHVEGDPGRFGLRVGTAASNENRTDLKASKEEVKVIWVKRVRELTQGLLPLS
uniref:DH domain-containing protein n=1 Tax=Heterorhabditis bacteriophora TaxID=37862 RepID=A0A1I7WT87_HETBA